MSDTRREQATNKLNETWETDTARWAIKGTATAGATVLGGPAAGAAAATAAGLSERRRRHAGDPDATEEADDD